MRHVLQGPVLPSGDGGQVFPRAAASAAEDQGTAAVARYRGQKVVVMSPDYSEATKFADEWVPVAPGTDAALGMALGHVVLKEFFAERRVLHQSRINLSAT